MRTRWRTLGGVACSARLGLIAAVACGALGAGCQPTPPGGPGGSASPSATASSTPDATLEPTADPSTGAPTPSQSPMSEPTPSPTGIPTETPSSPAERRGVYFAIRTGENDRGPEYIEVELDGAPVVRAADGSFLRPTGTVTLLDGSTRIGEVDLGLSPWEGHSLATFSYDLVPGRHTLTASYSGDANYLPASVARPANIRNATVTVTASSSGTVDVPFTVEVRVQPILGGMGTPTGKVRIREDFSRPGVEATLDEEGSANLAVTITGAGKVTFLVQYDGDENFSEATSDAIQISIEEPAQ